MSNWGNMPSVAIVRPRGWLLALFLAQGLAAASLGIAQDAGGPRLGLPTGPVAPPAAPPPPALPSPGPRQLVVAVQFVGQRATKEHQIQQHVQTRRDREFDPELVQADVRRLLQTGLFRDVTIKTQQVDGGVVVIYEFSERPRINYIRYLGNRRQSEKALAKEHGLKIGDPLNAYSAQEARRKIEELYHANGCTNASVTLVEGDEKEDQGIVFVINEGQLERIEAVVFEGNTIASDSRLKTQVESKPGWFWYFFRGKVERQKIEADVQKLTAYYRNLGYFKARVGRELEFDDSGKWLTIKFIIDEGPRYVVRNVSVEGNQKFASQPMLDFLKLKSGEHFNQSSMNRDLNTIVDLYGSQGHVFADVQPDLRFLEEPGQLDLVYRIQEGDVFRVGEINVKIGGEFPHTRQTVVLNRLGLRPGDLMDSRKIKDAERRLKASQLFEVDPQQGDPPRIAIRPPDANAYGNLAEQPKPKPTIRGQSPDHPAASAWPPVRIPAPPLPAVFSWDQLRQH
jgi:outer membrane protein insertion porin family